MKISRNDVCSCGSGKKYKKCCIDKEIIIRDTSNLSSALNHLYSYEEINALGTDVIIEKLESMNISFNQVEFLEEIRTSCAAEEISEGWFKKYKVIAEGSEEDFPFFASWVLWERLAPANVLSREQMGDLLELGYDYLQENNPMKACDVWLKVWEALKYHNSPVFATMYYLEERYSSSFSVKSFVRDLEMELHNAGLNNPGYFDKRIIFCREFCDYFPGEDKLIIHNMKRAIGNAYAKLNDFSSADKVFKGLINEYPDNPCGYIGWGDIYPRDNEKRARELYEKALKVSKDKGDIEIVQERIDYL